MLLFANNRKLLTGKSWYCLSLSSHSSHEQTMRNLGRWLRKQTASTEVFCPQDSEYLFARSTQPIQRLTRVRGLALVTATNELPITVQDEQVQQMIAKAREQHSQTPNLPIGTFVRILKGQAARYCGTLTKLNPATVTIQMHNRKLIVQTPLRNLESLNHIAAELRSYYCEAIPASD